MDQNPVLTEQIQMAVARGGRIESQQESMAVIVTGQKVNHVLHFIIGFVTFGIWWIVWAVMAMTGGEKREMISVDEEGNVTIQEV